MAFWQHKFSWQAVRKDGAAEDLTIEAAEFKAITANAPSWAKLLSFAVLLLIVITGLGPAKFAAAHVARLGGADHFLGYFVVTLIVCFAWPRPSVLLETLQGLTPDRSPNLFAVLYEVAGVLLAALLAEVFIRLRNRGKV